MLRPAYHAQIVTFKFGGAIVVCLNLEVMEERFRGYKVKDLSP